MGICSFEGKRGRWVYTGKGQAGRGLLVCVNDDGFRSVAALIGLLFDYDYDCFSAYGMSWGVRSCPGIPFPTRMFPEEKVLHYCPATQDSEKHGYSQTHGQKSEFGADRVPCSLFGARNCLSSWTQL